jgi:diaminopimelate decarboxylase
MEKAALQAGRNLKTISVGGGLPVPYRQGQQYVDLDRYFQLWDQTRKRLEDKFGHGLNLEIEPGRYLVAESGYLIAEIRAVKRQAGNLFYLLDAGFNNLARPILYGAYHPMAIVPATEEAEKGSGTSCRNGPSDASHKRRLTPFPPRQEVDVIVGGPLCESGDIFTQEEGGVVVSRRLPTAAVGEYLVIEVAGAYGAVMGSNYNSKPLAAEVLIQDGHPRLIRRRQTFDDLIRGETL